MTNLNRYFRAAAESRLIQQVLILLFVLFVLKIYREGSLKSERVLYFDRDLQHEKGIACAVIVPEGMDEPFSLDEVLALPEQSFSYNARSDLDRLRRAGVPWHKLDVKAYPWLSPNEIFALALQTRVDDVPVWYAVLLLFASLRLYSAVPAITKRRRKRRRSWKHYLSVTALGVALGFVPQLAHIWDNGPIHGTFFTHWFIRHITILSWIDGVLYIYLGMLAAVFVMDYEHISRRCLTALKHSRQPADRVSMAVFSWVPVATVIFLAFAGVKVFKLLEIVPLRYSANNFFYSLLVLMPPALVCVFLLRRYREYVTIGYDISALSPTLVPAEKQDVAD